MEVRILKNLGDHGPVERAGEAKLGRVIHSYIITLE